jgi:hypothetical protein
LVHTLIFVVLVLMTVLTLEKSLKAWLDRLRQEEPQVSFST